MIVRRARRLGGPGDAWPSMTPMVDVVLVILIFFMASAALLGPEWFIQIRAVAPEAEAGEGDPFALAPARVTIALEREGGRTLASGAGLERAPLAELEGVLRGLLAEAGAENLDVVIEPGPGVSYEDVIEAADLANRAGAQRLGLR